MVYIDEHIWDFDLDAALAEISEQRREQALRFKHELGRRQCVLAYLLLKRGLREAFGIEDNPVFEFGEHGKPAIVGHADVFFNLSHCREAVACVVDRVPVGIDVESVCRYDERLARYTMNDDEMAEILSSDNPGLTFTRLWTMKEALLKRKGRGLVDDLKHVLCGTDARFETSVGGQESYVCTVSV